MRFELTYMALAPELKIIVPWREWTLQGRADCVDYAKKHGIPVPVTQEKPYSSDRNLLHISFEGGILEDPWAEPPADMFVLTKSPQDAPDQPQYLEIDFESGDPVAVDGQKMSPFTLLDHLNRIGGTHGIGRVDLVENRYVGLKSRGVYETPGRHDFARRPPRRGIPDPGPGGHAPAGQPDPPVRRNWSTTATGSRRNATPSRPSSTRPRNR